MNSANRIEPEVELIVLLRNGVELPKVEHDEFRCEIVDAIRWLPTGVTCRIDHLVTPKFWLSKSSRKRRLLGRVLAYWVANGELPLEFVGDRRRGNKRYRRKT
jgi:hypothetical protein